MNMDDTNIFGNYYKDIIHSNNLDLLIIWKDNFIKLNMNEHSFILIV